MVDSVPCEELHNELTALCSTVQIYTIADSSIARVCHFYVMFQRRSWLARVL